MTPSLRVAVGATLVALAQAVSAQSNPPVARAHSSASAPAARPDALAAQAERIGTQQPGGAGLPRGFEHMGAGLTPEQRQAAIDIGRAAAEAVQNRASGEELPRQMPEATAIRQRYDQLADATLQASREETLRLLGIDPAAESALYVFVSLSMPLDLLRSYVVESMWSGATLVLKGMPEGKRDLHAFLTKDLAALVYGKGAAANIAIDPRLFDLYDVQAVPAIVFSNELGQLDCADEVAFKYNDVNLGYARCKGLPDASYRKVSGAVTVNWALELFEQDGATGVAPHLKSLREAYAGGTPAKVQAGFKGQWEEILTPEDKAALQAAKEAVEGMGSAPSPGPGARRPAGK